MFNAKFGERKEGAFSKLLIRGGFYSPTSPTNPICAPEHLCKAPPDTAMCPMHETDSFVDVSSLSSFLESIGSHLMDLIFMPQSRLKEGAFVLYHFTDLAGLIGIVNKHDLWLTHSLYSNDAEEMIHGITVV